MLLVIGNGFDVNLGLKTKYSDYLLSIQNSDSFRDTNLYEHLSNAYLNSGLKERYRWVDIENELKLYVESNVLKTEAGNHSSFATKFREEFGWLNQNIEAYINQVAVFDNIKKSHAKDYTLEIWKKLLELKGKPKPVSTNENNDLEILSFNYTTNRVLKPLFAKHHKTYNIIDAEKSILDSIQYHEVHGNLESKNIVLGIEGKANLPIQFNFLKKGLQPHYPSMVKVESLLTKHREIYFYGFSIGETDAPYFREFFSAYSSPETRSITENKITKTIIFYHFGQTGYDQIISRIDELTDKNVDRLRQHNNVKFIDIENYKESSFEEKYFVF
jgi:hypothetical protein